MHTCDRRRTVTKISISLLIGSLAAYAVFHTPARQIIAGLLSVNAGRCYFCGPWPTPERLIAAASAVLFIICAIVASIRGARRFPGMKYELPIVSAVLFTFFIAVPASVVGGVASWFGYPLLRAPVGPIVCGVIVMAFIVGDLSRKRPRKVRTWTDVRLPRRRSFLPAVLMSLAALLLLLSAAIAFLHPPRAYDALAYHAPLGILIWRDGDLTTYLRENPEYWSLAHPATAEILYGLLQVAGGEALANLGQLPFALLGAASVYGVARRLRCSARSACVAAASFLLAPIVISQIGTQLNDLAGAALVLAAVALMVGQQRDRSVGRPVVVGIALGLAVTTKLLLIPVVVVVLAGAAVVSVTSARNRMSRLTYGQLLVTVLVVCAIATPWWLRNLVLYHNPVYPAALPFVSRGVSPSDFVPKDREFVPTAALWPIYPVLEPHNDQSGFGPIVGIAGIIGLTLRIWRPLYAVRLFVSVTALGLPVWWFSTRHEPRVLMYLFGLLAAFVPWLVTVAPGRWKMAMSGVLIMAALFSAAVTVDQVLLPIARQPVERASFYDHAFGVDPTVLLLPEHITVILNTGFAPFSYTAYYPLMGQHSGRHVIAIDAEDDTEGMLPRMKRAGAEYLYVSVAPEHRSRVDVMYTQDFELVHASTVSTGPLAGITRLLYHAKK